MHESFHGALLGVRPANTIMGTGFGGGCRVPCPGARYQYPRKAWEDVIAAQLMQRPKLFKIGLRGKLHLAAKSM